MDYYKKYLKYKTKYLELKQAGGSIILNKDNIRTYLYNDRVLNASDKMITQLYSNVFDNLTNLKAIDLSYNQIVILPAKIFDNLTNLEVIRLSYTQITDLPAKIFDNLINLESIELNNNKITKLPANIFDNLKQLQNIYLNNNQITKLPAKIFDNLKQLQNIDLSNNPITELPDKIFDNLINLESIELSGNEITKLPDNIFDKLTQLESINLSANQIIELPDNIFDKLTILKHFDLFDNQITTLPAKIFDKLTQLQNIYLNNNQITNLRPKIFDKLINLKVIDLSNNQITKLPDNIFDNLTNLKSINLSNNKIKTLPDNIFDNLTNLESIDFNVNQITTLPDNIFEKLTQLQNIYLGENTIKSMNKSVFGTNWKIFNYNITSDELIIYGVTIDKSIIPDESILPVNLETVKKSDLKNIISNESILGLIVNIWFSNVKITSIKSTSKGATGSGYSIELANNKKFHLKISKGILYVPYTEQEFKLFLRMKHPNIMKEIDAIKVDSTGALNLETNTFINPSVKSSEPYVIILSELFEGTIDKFPPFNNIVDIYRFMIVMLDALYYINKMKITHQDIKEKNIGYYTIVGHYFYKLFDFGISSELTLEEGGKVNRTTNYLPKPTSYSFTRGYFPEEDDVISEKVDIYSLGVVLNKLLTNSKFVLTQSAAHTNITKMIKLLIKKMNAPEITERSSILGTLNILSNIFHFFPIIDKYNIIKYLKTNYKQEVEYDSSAIYNKDDLPKVLQIIITNFEYSNDELCSYNIDKLKLTHGTGLSPISFKFIVCNYIDYNDKITESYLDPGHSRIAAILKQGQNITRDNILVPGNQAREILVVSPETITYINTSIDSALLGISSLYNRMLLLAESVYRQFNTPPFESKVDDFVKQHTNLTKIIDIKEFRDAQVGVCRHRSLLFKLLCDKAEIPCRLIRGQAFNYDGSFSINHAWNIVRIDGKSYGIDIMNPNPLKTDITRYIIAEEYESVYLMPRLFINKKDFKDYYASNVLKNMGDFD